MKAITIKQPYATLIMNGSKTYEMRTWRPNGVDLLAIHAAAKPVDIVDLFNSELDTDYWDCLYTPLGCILGIVKVVRVIDTETMTDLLRLHWNDGLHPRTFQGKVYRYAWQLEVIEVFTQPVAATGKLGLWEWSSAA